jgi:hypothetical protein
MLKSTHATVLWLLPPCFAAAPGSGSDPNAPWYNPSRIAAVDAAYTALAARQGFLVTNTVKKTSCPVSFAVQPDGTHYSDPSADLTTKYLVPDLQHALAVSAHR